MKKIITLLLSLFMVVTFVPARQVRAEELPDLSVNVTPDALVTWDASDIEGFYQIAINVKPAPGQNGVTNNSNKMSQDVIGSYSIKEYASSSGWVKGIFEIEVYAEDKDHNLLTNKYTTNWNYTTGLERLAAPTDVTFDGMNIFWNAVPHANQYRVYIFRGPSVTGYPLMDYTTSGTSYSVGDDPLFTREEQYTVAVYAQDTTNTYAESLRSASATHVGWFDITEHPFSAITVDANGLVSFDQVPGSFKYLYECLNFGGFFRYSDHLNIFDELEKREKPEGDYTIGIYGVNENQHQVTEEGTANFHYTPKQYAITALESENGTFTVASSAIKGEEVTVTVTPEHYYGFESLTVTYEDGHEYTYETNTFKMPNQNVSVKANFTFVGKESIDLIEVTSDISSILVLDNTIAKPTYNLVEGAQYRFANIKFDLDINGRTFQQNPGTTVIAGDYVATFQIRLEDENYEEYKFGDGMRVVVDGVEWIVDSSVYDSGTYAYTWARSPKMHVDGPAAFVPSVQIIPTLYIGQEFEVDLSEYLSGGLGMFHEFEKISGPGWISVLSAAGVLKGTPEAGTPEPLVVRVTEKSDPSIHYDLTIKLPTPKIIPEDREIVYYVEAQSNLSEIIGLNKPTTKPTLSVVDGFHGRFANDGSNGRWQKYNGVSWSYYTEPTFTPGVYRYSVQYRLDYEDGELYKLDKNLHVRIQMEDTGIWPENAVGTMNCDWSSSSANIEKTYSYAWVYSPEFEVVDVTSNHAYQLPESFVGDYYCIDLEWPFNHEINTIFGGGYTVVFEYDFDGFGNASANELVATLYPTVTNVKQVGSHPWLTMDGFIVDGVPEVEGPNEPLNIIATIDGKDYELTVDVGPTLTERKLSILDIEDQYYNGGKLTPWVSVIYGGVSPETAFFLQEGVNYTVKYSNNVKAGLGTVTVTGKGNYSGKVTKTFNILPSPIYWCDYGAIFASYTPGKDVKISTVVKDNGKALKLGTDYVFTYEGNTVTMLSQVIDSENPYGYYDLAIEGKGNYGETANIGIYVYNPQEYTDLSKATVTIPKNITYTGSPIHFASDELVVTLNKKVLVRDVDYEVYYDENISNEGCVTIEGIGQYVGYVRKTFPIVGKSISTVQVIGLPDTINTLTALGEGDPIEYKLMDGDYELVEGEDYWIEGEEPKKLPGSMTVYITGYGKYSGTIKKTIKIVATEIDPSKVIVQYGGTEVNDTSADLYYAKDAKRPLGDYAIDVLYDGMYINPEYYTIKYANAKSIGNVSDAKAPTLTVVFKGLFKGTYSTKFTLNKANMDMVDAFNLDVVYSSKPGSWKNAKPTLVDRTGVALALNKDYVILGYVLGYESLDDESTWTPFSDGYNAAGNYVGIIVEGIGNFEGRKVFEYKICEKSIAKLKATVKTKEYDQKGIYLDPQDITIMDGTYRLVEGVDYEIKEWTYQNNYTPGSATVEVRGINNYSGEAKLKFKIVAKSFVPTVSFDANGGSGKAMKAMTVYPFGSISLPNCTYVKEGMTFAGWNTEADGSGKMYKSGDFFIADRYLGANVVLYAIWEN